MQYEKAGGTPTAEREGLKERWGNLSHELRGQFLRKFHNDVSADMVMLSLRSPSPPIGLSLVDSDDPALIAALCKAHILDTDSQEYRELVQGGAPVVRLDLLSGLLRMADILEESRRRANRSKANTLMLPLLSQAHWWRHYYTRDVFFSPADKTITLVFDFPATKRDEYSRVVPQLHLPNILKELRRHEAAFARSGIVWVITSKIEKSIFAGAEEMPPEVESMMLGMLKDEADHDAIRRRRQLINVFEQARPLAARLLNEVDQLPLTTAPEAKAVRLEAVADQFHNIGAHYGEASVLQSAYRLYEQAGHHGRQLELGIRLIGLLLQQSPDGELYHLIQECDRMAETTGASPEQRLTLHVSKARLLNEFVAYPQMVEAYQTAIDEARFQQKHDLLNDLVVELAEAQYLIGDIALARKTIAEVSDWVGGVQLARVHAVVARLDARSHGGADAMGHLARLIEDNSSVSQDVRAKALLRNAQAQILFLSGRFDESSEILSLALDDITLADHPRLRVALERNRRLCFTPSSMGERLRQHDEVRDAVAVSGHGADYALSLLAALDEQAEGKHTSAMPRFWRELRESYRSEEWQRYWEAETYFATECVATSGFGNDLDYAALHAIQALSVPMVEEISNNLLVKRLQAAVHATLSLVIGNKLLLHFIPACRLIEMLSDAVPDDLVSSTLEYLLTFATTDFQYLTQLDATRPAWKALSSLGKRLTAQQSMALMTHISLLDLSDVNAFLLQHILSTIGSLIANLPDDGLASAAQVTLPHALCFPKDLDHHIYYSDALNVLAHISTRADATLKNSIGQALFPPGSSQMDSRKLLLLPVFREGAVNKVWINEFAVSVTQTIRRQVQEYGANEVEPESIEAMQRTQELEGGGRRICRLIGTADLQAALAFDDLLEPSTAESLFRACLDMVVNTNNFMSNRIGIMRLLPDSFGTMSISQSDHLHLTLLSLARGEGVSEVDRQTALEAQDPMNRLVLNLGNPAELQGAALRALARLHQAYPERPQDVADDLLQQALVSPEPILRREAAYATLELSSVSETLLTALMCGLRDSVPEIAEACYWSLARKQPLQLDAFRASLMITSLQLSLHSEYARVRRGAAALSSHLKTTLPLDGTHMVALESIKRTFARDICHSVRAVTRPISMEPDTKTQ